MTVAIVLGSASPARLRLLHAAGVEPRVFVSDVDEEAVTADARQSYGELEPAEVALLLARAKAEAVSWALADRPDHLVLGCDSILDIDGEVHGKPVDSAEVMARWQRMRGRSGTLHTGHWLIDDRAESTGAMVGAIASTVVHFAHLDDEEISAYIATGEPLRVAGAFTIDGLGGPYVTRIEGDHSNVVGLSLPLLRDLLRDVGLDFHDLRGSPAPA